MGKPQAITQATYRTSKPDHWTTPRPFSDASARLKNHGPVQPMPTEARDWFTIGMRVFYVAVALIGVTFAFLPAASPVSPAPDAQQPTAFEARAGGKVSP